MGPAPEKLNCVARCSANAPGEFGEGLRGINASRLWSKEPRRLKRLNSPTRHSSHLHPQDTIAKLLEERVIRRRRQRQAYPTKGISAQVLNEFTSVAHKKRQRPWPEIEAALSVIRDRFPVVVPITAEIHARAVALARDHGFAFYDALIFAAALEAGCDTLITEDMQHGRAIDGVTIRNPFREDLS